MYKRQRRHIDRYIDRLRLRFRLSIFSELEDSIIYSAENTGGYIEMQAGISEDSASKGGRAGRFRDYHFVTFRLAFAERLIKTITSSTKKKKGKTSRRQK